MTVDLDINSTSRGLIAKAIISGRIPLLFRLNSQKGQNKSGDERILSAMGKTQMELGTPHLLASLGSTLVVYELTYPNLQWP